MTRVTFLKLFAQTVRPKEWSVTVDGSIRHRKSDHCPLSWIASRKDKTITACAVYPSARTLGLPGSVADRIVDAADGVTHGPTRKALLTTIGR